MELEHIENGECKCCDVHISCIDMDQIEAQASHGYKFKLNGKTVTVSQIRAFLAENGASVPAKRTLSEPNQPNPTTRKVRAIRCLNNKKVYRNMSEAAKDLGLDSAQISYSLKVSRPTKGYSFEFVEE